MTRTVDQVAEDLTAIADMAARLQAQAVNDGGSRLMPGGLAMVSLAAIISLEAWQHRYCAAEHNGRDTSHIEDEDDAWEPPLQTLLYWSEQWRVEHGAVTDRRPTIASEAAFIRSVLHWAHTHELHWADFADDIRTARRRMEDMLTEGDRADSTRVTCDQESCAQKPRKPQLIRVWGRNRRGIEDHWKCPACKRRYTEDDRTRMLGRQLHSERAEQFVTATDARSVLATQGRPARTVRKWTGPQYRRVCRPCRTTFTLTVETCTYCDAPTVLTGDGEAVVRGYCDLGTHRTWLWWPDLWELHREARQRTRRRAS